MKHLAKQLAQQGRHGDTELLHVSKPELALLHGIGALTGRRVTQNPTTGLPEAFDFSSLIPAVVGIGGSILSGGTLSPLMAGLISGAATTAATGDITRGLAAGLGGGMMTGLGSSIAGMGMDGAAGAAGEAVGQAINPAAHFSDAAFDAGQAASAAGSHFSDAAMDAGMQSAASGPMTSGFSGPAAYDASMQAPGGGGFSFDTFKNNLGNGDAWKANFGGSKMLPAAMGVMSLASNLGSAIGPSGGSAPSSGPSKPVKFMKANRQYLGAQEPNGIEQTYFSPISFSYASGGQVTDLPPEMQDSGSVKAVKAIRSRYRSKQAAVQDMQVNGSLMQQLGIMDPNHPLLQAAFGYTAKQGKHGQQAGGMVPAYAGGGKVDPGLEGMTMQEFMAKYPDDWDWRLGMGSENSVPAKYLDMPVTPAERAKIFTHSFDPMMQRQPAPTRDPGTGDKMPRAKLYKMPKIQMAQGGPVGMHAGIGAYAHGGMIKGPGDGMSDNVPAIIDQRQPARLSNDEHVIPADAVSHLGNGSSDAGHALLSNMVGRIRAARTGSMQQAPAINPKKVLPR